MDGFPLRVRSARANRREVQDLSEGVRRRPAETSNTETEFLVNPLHSSLRIFKTIDI